MISLHEKIELLSRNSTNSTFALIAKKIRGKINENIFPKQQELAEECFVSPATISLFAKHMECSGYKEFVVRLKVESENFKTHNKKDNNIIVENRYEVINSIIEWMKINDSFIKEISSEIRRVGEITIFSSLQSWNSVKYFNHLLWNKNIKTRSLNQTYSLNLKMAKKETATLNFIILCGRDTQTLIDYNVKQLANNKSAINFLLSTNSQHNKINIKLQNKLILNFEFDDSQYENRNLALHMLLFQIFNDI